MELQQSGRQAGDHVQSQQWSCSSRCHSRWSEEKWCSQTCQKRPKAKKVYYAARHIQAHSKHDSQHSQQGSHIPSSARQPFYISHAPLGTCVFFYVTPRSCSKHTTAVASIHIQVLI